MKTFTMQKVIFTSAAILMLFQPIFCNVTISSHDARIKLNQHYIFTLDFDEILDISETINLTVQHEDILKLNETSIEFKDVNVPKIVPIEITAIGGGHCEIYARSSNNKTNLNGVFIRVTVFKNDELDTFSSIIGWIYFVAWSISFYPQIYINWKRKSVVGLNFDFIVLNLVGFTLYSIFNLGLYYIPEIKDEYSHRYPRGLIPVKVNDIVFAVHATIATIITIAQCFIYEREEQRVSTTARSILGIFGTFILISIILSSAQVIHWLDFLYYCSYVKLTITLIKYIPQAYMNYKRKSTIGWSIGNIFLDFTGGILSMLQMIVDSYNYDDWVSIFGDPTKFGLGLFSVIFDIFFIIQHYILYRHTNYDVNYA